MRGDDEFYDVYLAPLERRLLRTTWRIVRDTEKARDALQDALIVVWKRREQVRTHPNPDALILRICISSAIDLLRREGRHETAVLQPPPSGFEAEAAPTPWTALERSRLEAEVRTALGRLSEKQAAAVFMRIVEGEDYATIARALDCAETTARIHVMRGRARLGRMLRHLRPAAQGWLP